MSDLYPVSELLSHLAIILVRPKFSENIGAAARVACNMGIERLILVRDQPPDREAMAKLATHKAAHILETMPVYDDLAAAVAPFSLLIGTTARHGRQRALERGPREVVEAVLPDLPQNEVAILFGPEDAGLTNDDLKYCQLLSSIPTAGFSSLNLAQAVAIHCYEFFYALEYAPKVIAPRPRLADSHELEGMYAHVEEALARIDFLQETNHAYWMNNIRQFFARMRLGKKDAKIIRGICRQFLWHQEQKAVTDKRR
ncbi:MAG: RNA methyltransferase [Desulfobulbaceae bacterium]|jgi:tRNA/rRNA methyltransferase|nr:RNA methyltransferase [Desulfobulbaceae bacterium]